jgi:hypothetical protein
VSQKVISRQKTFTAAGALAANRLVKLQSAGTITYAGATDPDVVGVTAAAAFAAGDKIPVDLISSQGTFKVESGGTITLGAELFQAASGTVAATGTVKRGTALEAAASADIFEAMFDNRLTGGAAITLVAGAATDEMLITITMGVAAVHVLEFWFSDAATGIGLTGTTISGALTIVSTFGAIHTALTAKKHVILVTNAAGIGKLSAVDSANTATLYPCIKNPVSGIPIVGPISGTNWEGV